MNIPADSRSKAINALVRKVAKPKHENKAKARLKAKIDKADWLADPIATKYIFTNRGQTGIVIRTPYSETLVDLAKSVPGRRYNAAQKASIYPFTSAPQIRRVAPKIAEAIEEALADEAAQAASKLAMRDPRFLSLMADCPAVGSTIRHNNLAVTIESRGKIFKVNRNMPGKYGTWLQGHEDESCCYVYYGLATPDEVAKLEAREVEEVTTCDAV